MKKKKFVVVPLARFWPHPLPFCSPAGMISIKQYFFVKTEGCLNQYNYIIPAKKG
jgi:hypothetical protein